MCLWLVALFFKRRQRCSWRCLATVKSAVRRRRQYGVRHHSSHFLLLKHWKQPHIPVWTQLCSRYRKSFPPCVCVFVFIFQKSNICCTTNPDSVCFFLQFKERDELARIFKSWIQPVSSPECHTSVSMSKTWDYRVRQHLGMRYDSKRGCFDWDLTMKLHGKGVFKDLVDVHNKSRCPS